MQKQLVNLFIFYILETFMSVAKNVMPRSLS